MKKSILLLYVVIFLLQALLCVPLVYAEAETVTASANTSNQGVEDFIDDFGDLFVGSSASKIDEEVYLGGYPLGITIDGDGVTVIGLN